MADTTVAGTKAQNPMMDLMVRGHKAFATRDLDELRARLIPSLILDGDRHPAEVTEVEVAKDHHQHQRHDQAEEECRAVAQVAAKEQCEEAKGLPHASRIS